MARKALDGFEFYLPGNGSGANQAQESTIVRSGGKSIKCSPPTGASGFYVPLTSVSADYVRVYVYLDSTGVGIGLTRGFLGNAAGGGGPHYRLNNDRTLALYSGAGVLQATSTDALPLGSWCLVQYRRTAASSADVLLINGVVQITTTFTGTVGQQLGATDTLVNGGYTAYFDDFAEDDAAFPGEGGKIVLALPASDNARNGWTGGVGGTTNLFDAVNNNPPIGTATETDLTQIESATNSATDNYDANMQSYATMGIASGDTVLAVQALCSHGEDIATGTKAGALTVVSNPAQTGEDTFNFGNDAGALGTWPTGWSIAAGTAQDASGVTLATSPVVRVGKRTATTRVVSCCFIGLYIEYVVADRGRPQLPPLHPVAVMRAANY